MTSLETNDDAQEAMASVSKNDILLELGQRLQSERHKRSLSIDVIASSLKVRKVYLKALEDGDWHEMPGEVYALAFLRQYADYLNLDMSSNIEKLKSGDYHLTKPLTFPDPPVAPNRTWMLIAAALFILLFVGFNLFNYKPELLSPEIVVKDVPHEQSLNSHNVSQEQELTTQVELLPAQTIATDSSPNVVSHTDSEAVLENDSSVHTINTVDTKNISTYNYKITAVTSDVWLQLHDSSEPPVLVREALLRKGQSMRVTYAEPLRLTSGNTLALQINLNGQPIIQVNQLGEKGKVLRNYLLQNKQALP